MKRLLLVGGGHAHLEVLRQFALHPMPDQSFEGVLVSSEASTVYSGMLPGVIAGHYRTGESQIDLAALVGKAGWRFEPDTLQRLDAASRMAIFASGGRLEYDLVSFDTGSVADLSAVQGAADRSLPLRPMLAFLRRWTELVTGAAAGKIGRIAVVGAGAAGVEVALAMAYRLSAEGGKSAQCRFALVTDTDTILNTHAPRVRGTMESILARRGIELYRYSAVAEVGPDALRTAAGRLIEADCTVWAAAGTAPAWPKAAGLTTDGHGYIAVDRQLRSQSHPEVFGGGDIVTLIDDPHPKSGVFAVRHGPILAANLRSALLEDTAAMRAYVPQQRALSLISAGNKYAVASWDRWSVSGRWVWAWKDRIDRRFVARYSAA